MQAQEVLRQLRIPELDELREYVRGLPANALMGMGAVAALTTYWFAFRPKAIGPRCDINQQSEELPVRDRFSLENNYFKKWIKHKSLYFKILPLMRMGIQPSPELTVTETGILQSSG